MVETGRAVVDLDVKRDKFQNFPLVKRVCSRTAGTPSA